MSGDIEFKQNNINKIIINTNYIKVGKFNNIEQTIDLKANITDLSSLYATYNLIKESGELIFKQNNINYDRFKRKQR